MTLGYLFGATISDANPEHGARLYAEHPVMRDTLAEVGAWTGLDPHQLLRGDFQPANDHERFSLTGVRLAALAFGITDVLAERGIHPAVVGGISLGGLVSTCVAGAVERRDLFDLLLREGTAPPRPADAPAQGAAIAFLPADEDDTWYYGARRPDVYLGGDFGRLADSGQRLLMLSGTRTALDALVAQCPPGRVSIIEEQTLAVHSPLRRYAQDFMADAVEALPISDPRLPVCSFQEQRTLRTAAEIRDLFRRNKTHTMSLPYVTQEMKAVHGVRLALSPGPALPVDVLRFPFPVVRVDQPEHVTQSLGAIYEYAVDVPATIQ